MRLRKNTIALAAAACTLLITNAAQAVVTFTFAPASGDRVIALVTGSLALPVSGRSTTTYSYSQLTGMEDALFTVTGSTTMAMWQDGTSFSSGLNRDPDVSTMSSFGYIATDLYLPASLNNGNVYTIPPGMSFTWNNAAGGLTSLGLGSLTSSPLTVFTNSSDSIRFTAVPEPTSLLLGALSLLTFLARRRRGLAN